MTRLIANITRLSVLSAGVAGIAFGAVAPANAQQQQQRPQGWFKVCDKQQDVDVCNVQNIATAQTGQLVTAVSMIELKGKVNRKVFQVTVPTGRLLPPGIVLQIDSNKGQKMDYMVCLPDRCVAEAPLNDALVNSFKKGTSLTLTSVNVQQQPNPVKMSLQGFTGAYDGEPLKNADVQERQNQLQEFVKKNNEEFAKKLKEEQDKAKAGN